MDLDGKSVEELLASLQQQQRLQPGWARVPRQESEMIVAAREGNVSRIRALHVTNPIQLNAPSNVRYRVLACVQTWGVLI